MQPNSGKVSGHHPVITATASLTATSTVDPTKAVKHWTSINHTSPFTTTKLRDSTSSTEAPARTTSKFKFGFSTPHHHLDISYNTHLRISRLTKASSCPSLLVRPPTFRVSARESRISNQTAESPLSSCFQHLLATREKVEMSISAVNGLATHSPARHGAPVRP